MKSLFVFAAATAAVLASAAFVAPGPGGGIPHPMGRAADRLTVGTDDHAAMCTATRLDHVGKIGCVGHMPVTG